MNNANVVRYEDVFAVGTKSVTITVAGKPVEVTVKDGLRLKDMQAITKYVKVHNGKADFEAMDSVIEIMKRVVVAWPFLDSAGKPVPVNDVTIGNLRGPIALQLFDAIEKDIFPSDEKEAIAPFVGN